MVENLTIKNFGPIKSVEIDLKKFTVLIGEQATGKSTIAKLLSVCRYFSYITNFTVSAAFAEDNPFYNGLAAWGISDFLQEESFIRYETPNYVLTAEYREVLYRERTSEDQFEERSEKVFLPILSKLSPAFERLIQLVNEYGRFDHDYDGFAEFALFGRMPPEFYQNEVANVLNYPLYIPAQRGLQSIFSLGKSSIQNLSDALFNQLGDLDRIARRFKVETQIEPLGITYKNIDGRGFFKKKSDKNFYSLFNAATGFQSTIPIVLALKYYSSTRKKSKSFTIEEPELSLFPTAQNALLKEIAKHVVLHGHSVFLTTHSPYILASLNNLLYAHKVGKDNSEEIGALISDQYWLNPDEMNVVLLKSDGTSENIYNSEEPMIKVERLDEISREINSQFDKIQDIELGLE